MQPQPKNDLVYILTILEAAGKIAIYTKAFDTAYSFYIANDQLNFNATLLLIATIGENVGKVSLVTKQKYSNISWQKIRDTRNRIVHDYTGIDFEITFRIATQEIPSLVNLLEDLVRENIRDRAFSLEELQVAQNSKNWYRHVNFDSLQNTMN